MGVDELVNRIMRPVADAVSEFIFFSVPVGGVEIPLIVAWLIAGGAFFTLYLGFINVRGFRHALDLVRGRYTDPSQPGEVTPFQALATAVSGTVGIGNIAGVAVAISLGGPGATLWLIIAGLLGMSTKFAECTLAVKYRRTNPDGSVSGGPMYYLQHGLELRNLPGIGRGLGMFYAAAMVLGCLGIGNMFPVQPGGRHPDRGDGRRRQLLQRQGLAAGRRHGRSGGAGHRRRDPKHRPRHLQAGALHGSALRAVGAGDHRAERRPAARRHRSDLGGGVLGGQHRRRHDRRDDHRVPAGRVLERGRPGLRRHRALGGADR